MMTMRSLFEPRKLDTRDVDANRGGVSGLGRSSPGPLF